MANVAEDGFEDNACFRRLKLLQERGLRGCRLSNKIESELASLADEEKVEFLEDMNLSEPGLNRLIRSGYKLLVSNNIYRGSERGEGMDDYKGPQCPSSRRENT